MKLFFNRIFIATIFIGAAQFCVAQVKFYAAASPLQAAKNEYISFTLTLENGEGEASINPPSFAGFTIVGGPTQSTMRNVIQNGSVTKSVQSISLNYILQAKGAGKYTIGTGAAVVGGKTLNSNKIQIEVTDKPLKNNAQNIFPNSPFDDIDKFELQKPQEEFKDYIIKDGENIKDKISKALQFNLQLSKTSCYVGEPIMVYYKLFSRLPTESRLDKFPSFNGVSVIDMTNDFNTGNNVQEKLTGKLYNVFTLCKAQLYPLQAGILTIESATVENNISFAKYDATGNGSLIQENVNLVSKPMQLNVLPLPEKNKPINFTGSVGNFTLEAKLESNNFATDKMGKLTITIEGSGNMQLLTIPTIEWPVGVEVFDVKTTDNIINSTMPISGSKTFEIPYAVDKAGEYVIPKIGYSFFNPTTKSYVSLTTNEINFVVTKGKGRVIKPTNNTIQNTKNKNTFSPVKLVGSILLILLVAFSYFFFFGRKKKKTEFKNNIIEKEIIETEKKSFISADKNYLEKTKQYFNTDNYNDFYVTLNEELKYFLAIRYNLPKETIKVMAIETMLDDNMVNNDLIIETKHLLQKIELELYSPFEKDKNMEAIYNRTQALIQAHILQET